MLTLTQAAQLTRRMTVFLLFTVVLGIFLYYIYSAITNAIAGLKPVPKPVVITSFGKIPRAKFLAQTFPNDIKYSIETLSGGIPSASPTAKVYFLPKPQLGLLTNITAISDARKLGFYHDPQSIDKKFTFNESDRELIFIPTTRNFTYTYDFINNGDVFEGEKILDKNSATAKANSFLNLLSAIPSDYDSSNPKITFLTFNGAQFIPTAIGDNFNATAVRVDFQRKSVEQIPVVTPKYLEGNIYVIISKSTDTSKEIIKAQRLYQEISYENIGIYPIKSGQLAWEDFLSGNGYIADPADSTFTKKVVIRDASLAYFDNPEQQTYLTPIYVFTGDNGFVAFANAISDEWLTND